MGSWDVSTYTGAPQTMPHMLRFSISAQTTVIRPSSRAASKRKRNTACGLAIRNSTLRMSCRSAYGLRKRVYRRHQVKLPDNCTNGQVLTTDSAGQLVCTSLPVGSQKLPECQPFVEALSSEDGATVKCVARNNENPVVPTRSRR